jgi:hypothetical protein
MATPRLRSLQARFASAAFVGAAALISSLWIAICAAAPEFIWQGSRIALVHLSREDLLSAFLIGLVLAFFVQPAMEGMQHLLTRATPGESVDKPREPLFTAGVSLAFALASVCLHEAMTAFVSGRSAENIGSASGLTAGTGLTIEWAIVPFFVTLAWLSAGRRWLAIPTGIIAGASSLIAGWMFSWGAIEVITTAVPCMFILILGYNQAIKQPRRRAFARCAQTVALLAAIWLATSLLVDIVLDFCDVDKLRLYSPSGFWGDVRFYFGWALGLALAPFPYQSHNGRFAGTQRP